MWLLVLAFACVCEAHVRLIHKSYFTLPIRNALTPSADGQLSVAGPCGGNVTWGNQGYSDVTVGDNVSLVFAYNGGHQSPTLNMLRISMLCGRMGNDLLLRNETIATVTSAPVNASDSLTTGYNLWVIIPDAPQMTNGQYCTISAHDMRGWGGCVDVEVNAKASPPPQPSGANALATRSVAGLYPFSTAQCTPDSPGCCCVTGTLNVTGATGATTASGIANFASCEYKNNTGFRTLNMSFPVMLTQQASTLASMKGSVADTTSNTVSFQLSAGATSNTLVVTDDSAVPTYCGLDYDLMVANAVAPASNSGSTVEGRWNFLSILIISFAWKLAYF